MRKVTRTEHDKKAFIARSVEQARKLRAIQRKGRKPDRAETIGSVHDGPVPKGCAQRQYERD